MNRKYKNIYFVIVLLFLFGITIGYAAMNRVLNITGNSEIKHNTWDIHFDNVKVIDGSVTANKIPTVENEKLSVDFNVMLNLPGDFYEFTVDVVNSGTIYAMIDSVVKTPELTDEQKKYINYIVEYQNGKQLTSKQLVSAGSFVRLKVRVEYRKDLVAEDLPTIAQELNLGFTLNYVQSDDTFVDVKNNGVIGATGDINEIGTVVTIGTEKFYTIGIEGDNVKLFAMYNLYVGGEYLNSWIEYGEEATGIQKYNMLGWQSNGMLSRGTTKFSNSTQHGTNYSDYEGSLVQTYVNNYKSYLESNFAVNIDEARLITYDELISEDIGCDIDNATCLTSEYPWIYSITYWTETAYDTISIWNVYGNGALDSDPYSDGAHYGVRPVIVISKKYFE